MNKILIAGTLAFDQIETPFGKSEVIMGGAANCIAIAAAQFGVPQAVVSVVGEDYPEAFLDILRGRKVDTSAVEIVRGGKSFFWSGRYHNDMNVRDTLDTQLNVLADFKPVVPEAFRKAAIVMWETYIHSCSSTS